MRPILFVFILLIAYQGIALAQPYQKFKIDTDEPENGQTLHFIYTGAFSRKISSSLMLYYEVKGNMREKVIKAKYNGVSVDGYFIVPDSALSFNVKARNRRDTVETFFFPIYKNGEALKGSLIAGAKFFSTTVYGIKDPKKFRALYLQEFSRYPDLKQKYLCDYYSWLGLPLAPASTIGAELNKIWADSLAEGKDEYFLQRIVALLMHYDHGDQDKLRGQIIARYPAGLTAFEKASRDFYLHKIHSVDMWTDLTAMEIKFHQFVATVWFDRLYANIAQVALNEKDIQGFDTYMLKIRSASIQRESYFSDAVQLLTSGADLQLAKACIQKAIALVGNETKNYYVFDKNGSGNKTVSVKGSYLDISAQIEYKLGNTAEAITQLETAIQIDDQDGTIKEHYLEYLLATGGAGIALEAASRYVEVDKANAKIRTLLREAYVQEKGSNNGYDKYYAALVEKAVANYTFPEYNKLNVPAINFTLKGTDGKLVSLSNYKGKAVVLYFLSTDDFRTNQDTVNIYFDEMVKAYKDSNIIFLAIDMGFVSATDEVSGKPILLTRVNEYLSRKNLKFKVLLDDHTPDPMYKTDHYPVTADDYGIDDVSRFCMIDKDGIVRYRSSYMPFYTETFKRHFADALKLVE